MKLLIRVIEVLNFGNGEGNEILRENSYFLIFEPISI